MKNKVKTAIFGKDLRVELKKHELSATGNKISIVPEGAGYFMPEIGPTTFLDWPSWKKFIFFGPRTYVRVFFVEKKGAKCVDFGEGGKVYGPDQEQVDKAIGSTLLHKVGKPEKEGISWYQILILLILGGIFLKVFGAI